MTSTLALDLVLLGFSNNDVHAGQILFQRPNGKLLEEILYFLLARTKPQDTIERLRDCWPIVNALQAKRFRAEVLRCYEDLRRNGEVSREIVLRKSMLDEGVGERLEEGLAKWAEFLLVRDYGEGDDEVPPMNGSAYTCEMLIPGSPLNQLVRIKNQMSEASRSAINVSIPVITPRPFKIPTINLCEETMDETK